jgi:hypothetical protein
MPRFWYSAGTTQHTRKVWVQYSIVWALTIDTQLATLLAGAVPEALHQQQRKHHHRLTTAGNTGTSSTDGLSQLCHWPFEFTAVYPS